MPLVINGSSARERWTSTPRLIRFFVIGGVNTVFGYTAYAALLYVGLHYAWAAFLGTIAGVIFNYFTTGALVFDRLSRSGIFRFVGVYGIVYLLNVACLSVLLRAGIDAYLGGLLLIVPMALVSFVLMKRFVFGSPRAAR